MRQPNPKALKLMIFVLVISYWAPEQKSAEVEAKVNYLIPKPKKKKKPEIGKKMWTFPQERKLNAKKLWLSTELAICGDLYQHLFILKPAGLRHEFSECNRLTHNASRPYAMPPKLPLICLDSNTSFFPLDSLLGHWLLLI